MELALIQPVLEKEQHHAPRTASHATVPPSGGPESSDFVSSFGFVMSSLLCRAPRSDSGRAAFLRSDLGVAWQKYYRRRPSAHGQ